MDQVHPEPDARLTVVFSSAESALVALATASLDQQQIDWFTRGAPGDALRRALGDRDGMELRWSPLP